MLSTFVGRRPAVVLGWPLSEGITEESSVTRLSRCLDDCSPELLLNPLIDIRATQKTGVQESYLANFPWFETRLLGGVPLSSDSVES